MKLSQLRPGDVIEGTVAEDVYSSDQKICAAGDPVHLTVDRLATRRRTHNDHWPWVITVFTPRHEKYPLFASAIVSSDGRDLPLQVSTISITRVKEVRAPAKGQKVPNRHLADDAKKSDTPVVTLEATLPGNPPENPGSAAVALPLATVTLPAGTEAKVVLLGSVSASGSHPGDQVQARVVQPVLVNSHVVLPEGTLIDGAVIHSKAPRTLSRAGALLLNFTGLKLQAGQITPIAASITEAQIDQRSHTRIDPEGQLLGERPGKAWMLINAGVTSGIAKEADDGTQLVIEAIVSTATDASTAGVAKIAATCASAVFMLTRHGRDVVIPKYSELTIVFDRPVTVGAQSKH